MSLDIFGRSVDFHASIKSVRGPPGIGFKHTADNQFDLQNKRLCNVAEPIDKQDAVTLGKFKKAMRNVRNEIQELRGNILKLEGNFNSLSNNFKANAIIFEAAAAKFAKETSV